MTARAHSLLEPVERVPLHGSLVLLDQRAGGLEHIVLVRVLDIDREAAGEPLGDVGMKGSLDVGDELLGGSDQQVVEAGTAKAPVQHVGDALQMAMDLLALAALVALLRPTARVRLREHVLRGDSRYLLDPVARPAEDARRAPIAQQDAPRARDEVHERLDERRVRDDHLGLHGPREPDDLEEAVLT
jgi:hypothetical protein